MPPLFSVVVPTRNRPQFVRRCLESLTTQTFPHFEVIVCDNHTGTPCRDAFDEWADDRFRYVTPSSPLPMHENWEFACAQATGEYVTVLSDKNTLRSAALRIAADAVRDAPVEVVSWWNEAYYPNSEGTGGEYSPEWVPRPPRPIDLRTELRRRLTFDVRRGHEGVHYHYAKICFGAYRRSLIERIRDRAGRLFFPIAPDYTSMTAALMCGESAVDLGQPLVLSTNSVDSNGRRQALYPAHARAFLAETDPTGSVIDALPLRGLYMSVHNLVAYDYVASIDRVAGRDGDRPSLDLHNLVLRAREDLGAVVWAGAADKRAQYAILRRYLRQLGGAVRVRSAIERARSRARDAGSDVGERAAERIRRHPALRAQIRRLSGKEADAGLRQYPSILAAAQAADEHYGVPRSPAVGR